MRFTFDEERHEYWLEGRKLPSVTQIMKPLTDAYLARVPRDTLERKRQIGQAVDAAITLDVLGTLDEESVFSAPWCGYFQGWRNFLRDRQIEHWQIWSAQRRMYHPQWMYAGTSDLEIFLEGWSVVDVKCTYELYPSVAIQTAAYKEMAGPEIERRHSLLLKPDGKYEFEEHDDSGDFGVFLSLLNVHNWREKHGC